MSSTTMEPGAAPAARAARRPRRGNVVERYALIGVWAIVAVVFCFAVPDVFPKTDTLQTVFGTQSVLLVLALGLIFPLITGQFDLSIASVLTLSSMLVAILNAQHGWPLIPAIVVALAAGLLVGCVNAALIVGVGVDSFIVTLGTSTLLTGLVQLIGNSQTISGVSNDLVRVTTTTQFLDISLSFWFALVLCVIVWFLLARTPLGRRLLVVGRGPEVARLSGMATMRLSAGALIACSFFAALGGVIAVGTQGGADPSSGASFLLPAFAAVYLGGTAITPGRFNVWGTFVAVYFLVTGITGLQFLGVDSYVQQLFYGGALVVAVVLARLVRRHRERAAAAAA
jgi:ribose transport system permease protein